MPGRAFCGAAQGDKAAIKAYYRLIEQPDDSLLTFRRSLNAFGANFAACEKARLGFACRRRLKIEPLFRPKFEPGVKANF
jgi:hypothetical protein